jgi:pyruvate dehydrogenase E2 component (dihydrolipoamide acetyltransferase)
MSIDITMPRLSDTMERGTILKWNVKEGDSVSAGDIIADVETDKATMEMSVYDDGTIARIAVPEGESVGVGTVIAVLAEEGEDAKDVAKGAAKSNGEAKKSEKKDTPGEEEDTSPVEVSQSAEGRKQESDASEEGDRQRGDGRMRISPVARRLADEHDIDVKSIQGSGPGGRIIKRDVMQAVKAGAETARAVPPSAVREEQMPVRTARVDLSQPIVTQREQRPLETRTIQVSNMRQTIAKRLIESKTTIPHYQVTYTFNMDAILALRRTLNKQLEAQGVKLSVNDFLVRACALAMHNHHEFNASWKGDSIAVHGEVNVGIAISLPAERGGGLLVATIRNADQKSLRMISAESKQLAEKARTRGLSIEEMSDSTFTISNLGMFGVEHFTAIINPPNSAIIAVGAAVEKPVVRNGELAIGHEMQATLSCDHRIIDGAMAAEYLNTLKQFIESPATLLV